MNTVETVFDGVKYIIPLPFEFAAPTHELYPRSFCGPQKSFLEKLVPDQIGGVNISVACHIHDESWAAAEPTWAAFHATNSIFLHNILAAVDAFSPVDKELDNRLKTALRYFRAVDTVGNNVFWELKKDQQVV